MGNSQSQPKQSKASKSKGRQRHGKRTKSGPRPPSPQPMKPIREENITAKKVLDRLEGLIAYIGDISTALKNVPVGVHQDRWTLQTSFDNLSTEMQTCLDAYNPLLSRLCRFEEKGGRQVFQELPDIGQTVGKSKNILPFIDVPSSPAKYHFHSQMVYQASPRSSCQL